MANRSGPTRNFSGHTCIGHAFQGGFLWLLLVVLVISTLACALTGNKANQIVINRRLPTLTATHLPTLTPTVASTVAGGDNVAIVVDDLNSPRDQIIPVSTSPLATPVPTVMASQINTPASDMVNTNFEATGSAGAEPLTISGSTTNEPALDSTGLSFVGVQNYAHDDNLMLYGDIVNNTGNTQEIALLGGTFYDAQGQLIADNNSVVDYWPVEIIPPGGRVPFELTVYGVQNVADFNLNIEAQPSNQTLNQEFTFLDLHERVELDSHCVTGRIQNLGSQLHTYLVIVTVLYNDQDRVIDFGEYYKPNPQDVGQDPALDFEVCSNALNQPVSRYELRAWGL